MADSALPDALRATAQRAWARYVDVLAPFRPELHRYCRALTGDLWDAESVHVHPDLPPEVRPPKWVNERAVFRGEPVMLSFDAIAPGRPLMGVARFEEEEGRIARLRSYIFCPETAPRRCAR